MFNSASRNKINDGNYKSGTGVIVDINRKQNMTVPILVTNKHLVEKTENIAIELSKNGDNESNQLKFGIEYKEEDFKCHETLDIAAVPLAPTLTHAMKQGITPMFKSIGEDIFLNENNKDQLSAIENVIFIGYPKGIKDSKSNLPIVRTGITASPIWNNFNNKPEFLVDAETFEGSSGSPVFIYNNGGYFSNGGLVVGIRIIFIGIIAQTIKDNENNYLGLGHVINSINIMKFLKESFPSIV